LRFASNDDGKYTICDARSYTHAKVNVFKGGGTEAEYLYDGCHLEFLNIGNCHDLASSIQDLRAGICQNADYSKSSNSMAAWFGRVNAVIKGAIFAAETVGSGESVVVHCSDGWDRTSQILSLASLLLDGHYRTIAGFPDLIEKDWLLPGHKFSSRNGMMGNTNQSDTAPVFLLFLDCVTQLWRAYPRYFEYTIAMLAFVLYHSYSGRYDTFFGNCAQERNNIRKHRKGGCVWTELLKEPWRWKNNMYDPHLATKSIIPCYVPFHGLAFSSELYIGLSCNHVVSHYEL